MLGPGSSLRDTETTFSTLLNAYTWEEAHKGKRFTVQTPGKSQESEATGFTKGIHGK